MSLVHWVWLGLAVRPGSPAMDRILSDFPDPEEFFLSGKKGIDKIGLNDQSESIRILGTTLDMANEAMESAEKYGAKIISRDMFSYPVTLRSIESAPAVLYVLGDEKCLNEQPVIGVVGTKHITDYGRKMTEIISSGLALSNATVISGLSKGIDAEAHKACIRNGGRTIAVQGCGICNTYPYDLRELKELIAANGAVISEFAPDSEAHGSYFTVKNRIISGLSLGICVIEAAAKSGTSSIATTALAQGRKVFAVPSDVLRSTSPGTFRLLKQGAIPVANALDILSEFKSDYPFLIDPKLPVSKYTYPESSGFKHEKITKKEIPDGVSENAAKIYNLVENNPIFADELSQKAGLSAQDAAAAFTELELYGLVKPIVGRRFVTA